MRYNEEVFLEKIKEGYQKYLLQGDSKSSEKLKPIHIYWADILQAIFGTDCVYHYNSKGYRIETPSLYIKKMQKVAKKATQKENPTKNFGFKAGIILKI